MEIQVSGPGETLVRYRHWHQNVGIIVLRLGDGRGLSDAHCDVAIVNLDIYLEVRSYLPSDFNRNGYVLVFLAEHVDLQKAKALVRVG